MMDIVVNNQTKNIPSESTVINLLEKMGIENKAGVAVAINKQVITRQKWDSTKLNENDQVLLIKASQGG